MSAPQHRVTVTLAGVEVPVEAGTLTIDETRAPRITASLTVPAAPELLELDPQRDVIWGTVSATVRNKANLRLRDLGTLFAAMTLGDLSDTFADRHLADIPEADPAQSWTLQLRSVAEHWENDTIELGFASVEQLLIDFIQPGAIAPIWDGHPANPASVISSLTVALSTTSILAAANQLLGLLGVGPITAYEDAAGNALSSPSQYWARGTSAWDKLIAITRPASLVPVSNGSDIELRTTSYVTPTAITVDSTSLLGGGQFIDRDAADFGHAFASVHQGIANGADPDPIYGTSVVTGRTTVAKTVFGGGIHDNKVPMPWKVLTVQDDDPSTLYFPKWAQAYAAYHRGRGWNIRAIAQYVTAPGASITVERPSGTLAGVVGSTEFSWPANEMTLSMREALGPAAADAVDWTDWWIY